MRKGDLLVMEPKGDLQHLEFDIPSRGLIGLRNNMLTSTSVKQTHIDLENLKLLKEIFRLD